MSTIANKVTEPCDRHWHIPQNGYIYLSKYGVVTTKKPKVTIYLNDEQKEELDKWAKSEKRSVSNLVGFLVDQALEGRKQKDKKSDKASN